MAQEKTCLRCGRDIAADAPEGLCLRCLMQAAMSKGPARAWPKVRTTLDTPATSRARHDDRAVRAAQSLR